MKRTLLTALLLATFTANAFAKQHDVAEDSAVPPLYRGLDPVALLAGQERAGDEAIRHVYRDWTFHFATRENRDVFLADPDRFAPQFDGACMRMGPLSGGGTFERFVVHEGRIYLLASESCLQAFQADPDRYADAPASRPESIDNAAAAPILNAAHARMGGEALDNIISITHTIGIEARSGEDVRRIERTITLLHDSFSIIDDYRKARYGWTIDTNGGRFVDKETHVGNGVADYMFRERTRYPAGLLLEWKAGRVDATAPVMETIDGKPLARILLYQRGAITTTWIDPETSRIIRIGFRGRGGGGIGDVIRSYSDFRTVGRLELPHAYEVLVNGTPLTTQSLKTRSIDVK